MQNLLIATSVALLASGADAALPKSNALKTFHKGAAAKRSTIKATKADPAAAKVSTLAAQTVMKEEIRMGVESHDTMFFEFARGMSDCSTTVGMVEGLEVNRCLDALYTDEEGDDDKAYGISEMIKMPGNGEFPIAFYYWGHGCREENIVDHFRLPKPELGFPPEYTTGTCMPQMAEDGTTVMFHQAAYWTTERHEPMYDAVMEGYDGREKGCQRGKFHEYSIMAAGLCMYNDDCFGSDCNFMFNVTNCNSEGKVAEQIYPPDDMTCSGPMTYAEDHHEESCLFDIMEFNDYLMMDGYAAFEYRSQGCHQEEEEDPS